MLLVFLGFGGWWGLGFGVGRPRGMSWGEVVVVVVGGRTLCGSRIERSIRFFIAAACKPAAGLVGAWVMAVAVIVALAGAVLLCV